MAVKKIKALSNPEIHKRVPELHGWKFSRGALRCEFKFETFKKAMQFVTRVADMAEEANHHPDIDIRYCEVRLALCTHSLGGVSDRDFSLAKAIDGKSAPSKSA